MHLHVSDVKLRTLRLVASMPPEDQVGFGALIESFRKYKPDLSMSDDYITPQVAVKLMRELIGRVTLADSGVFVSQFGDKKWI